MVMAAFARSAARAFPAKPFRMTPARRFASLALGPLSAPPSNFGRVGMPASATVVYGHPHAHVEWFFGFGCFKPQGWQLDG